MARLKVTVVGFYEADPEHYDGQADPAKMAAIDASAFDGDALEAVYSMLHESVSVTVEPA